ncbi:hypothetical protein ABVT39_020469 [Epinephelus coioides]
MMGKTGVYVTNNQPITKLQPRLMGSVVFRDSFLWSSVGFHGESCLTDDFDRIDDITVGVVISVKTYQLRIDEEETSRHVLVLLFYCFYLQGFVVGGFVLEERCVMSLPVRMSCFL